MSPEPIPTHASQKPKILLVEDDESLRNQLKWALFRDYEIHEASDRPSALDIRRNEYISVVVLDLGLPPSPNDVKEGFLALSEFLERDASVKVIVVTGQDEKAHALRAIDQGAYDFLSKPIQIGELSIILRRALHVSQLERENRELQSRLTGRGFEGILGDSPQMQGVFSAIRKVSSTDAPVLILGESGTGKELAARAIHNTSSRKDGPFVAINCGAIPENLLESELFGHEKGAFTGAHIRRKGRIELAQGGTLFLDEIGDLTLSLQAKLLRFLQEQLIVRVGGREEIEVDSRVVAASNKDLAQAIKENLFREDLYYRIGVVEISLPPLRDRDGDILLLARAVLQRFSTEINKRIDGFTTHAMLVIERHNWPGNVRELENRIKRAVIMTEGPKISPSDLELSPPVEYEGKSLREAREALESNLIRRALVRNDGNITKAAKDLGISRPTLYELMEKLGIEKNP